jgi:hypothetical protein
MQCSSPWLQALREIELSPAGTAEKYAATQSSKVFNCPYGTEFGIPGSHADSSGLNHTRESGITLQNGHDRCAGRWHRERELSLV